MWVYVIQNFQWLVRDVETLDEVVMLGRVARTRCGVVECTAEAVVVGKGCGDVGRSGDFG